MSNPTSNFNWQMPTATDLVTDLPADFEVFGQAVDTSLADLLGGTTGQVLSKTSGTDMDFTWVEQYPWQTWSPSYDNITVGNGTAVARYQQIGKTVNVRYQLTFGSTTTIAYLPGLSLPVTAAATAYNQTNLHLSDSGANGYFGSAYFSNTTYVYFFVSQANSTYSFMQGVSATIPFTWTTSDAIYLTMTYEAA